MASGLSEPELGKAQLSSLSWIEPIIVVGSMISALVINRRRKYKVFQSRTNPARRHASPDGMSRTSEDTLVDSENHDYSSESDDAMLLAPPKRHRSRSSSQTRSPERARRYSNNIHSRILQKFPFLLEMFYWGLNYAAYLLSKIGAAKFHGRKGIENLQLAQDHGIAILHFEHGSVMSFLFNPPEISVQQFFLKNHVGFMSVLNQIYSLVHIPGTVAFICWYYYAAPSFTQFSTARRTMALGNILAFAVFAIYPCMPPRLLPERFGFEDTVRQAHAESVWVGENGESRNFNQLAAMPSLHFTYALIIGSTLFWHSGFLQSLRGKPRERGLVAMVALMLAGVVYPALVLLVIVSTANHYYLDAVAAILSVIVCFACNRVWLMLLPAERLLARILRVDVPAPTTGSWRRVRGGGKSKLTTRNSALA